MKFLQSLAFVSVAAQIASAHYIWSTLLSGSSPSTAAIRQPVTNSPVESLTSPDVRCNASPSPASAVASVSAGASVGFLLDNTVYHAGPGAVYLGQVPQGETVTDWDGSGENWFKIAEFGVDTFTPFKFQLEGKNQIATTIPSNTPAGEYLLRVEQIGLHVAGKPQLYISCAQITVVNGGAGAPAKIAIPGPEYITESDPGVTVNIYNPIPTSYTVPGPAVWRG